MDWFAGGNDGTFRHSDSAPFVTVLIRACVPVRRGMGRAPSRKAGRVYSYSMFSFVGLPCRNSGIVITGDSMFAINGVP